MAYPTTLDSFPSAATLATHNLSDDPHSTLHGNIGSALAALEAKLGVDSSAVTSTVDYKISHLGGDLTGTVIAATIAAAAVTYSKIQNVAAHRFLGNNTASAASAVEMTAAQAKTELAIANTDVSGLGTMATQNANSVAITGGTISGITSSGIDSTALHQANNLSDVASQQTSLNNVAGAVTNNRVLAGDGVNVTLRALVATDIPALDTSKITTGTFAIGRIPTGTDGTHVPLGGVIAAAGPQGDASHTQVLTWNAAGQLTAATNTAIGSLDAGATTTGIFAIGRIPTGTDGTHVPLGGVISAAGPQGDSSHTQVLTWNAAGQLTAVTNTAISGAGIDSTALHAANNLSDVANASISKTNLKVGYATRRVAGIYGR